MERRSIDERPSSSQEGDQGSYFYVVWPEETVATLSAAKPLQPSAPSSHRLHPHRQDQLSLQEKQLQQQQQQQQLHVVEHSGVVPSPNSQTSEIEVFTSPLASPVLSVAEQQIVQATHSSAAVQTSPPLGVMRERHGSGTVVNGAQQMETARNIGKVYYS